MGVQAQPGQRRGPEGQHSGLSPVREPRGNLPTGHELRTGIDGPAKSWVPLLRKDEQVLGLEGGPPLWRVDTLL